MSTHWTVRGWWIANGTIYAGTLIGTIGNDVIVGTEAKDSMDAKTGNDTICGLGADTFKGGGGTGTATDFNAGEGDTRSSIP